MTDPVLVGKRLSGLRDYARLLRRLRNRPRRNCLEDPLVIGSAAELETEILPTDRLGCLEGNVAEAVLALHADVEGMSDSLIRSLQAKIDLRR